MTPTRVALVTGANRGIGLEICRQLAQSGVDVLLGARDSNKAQAAANLLAAEDISVKPQTVDVTSSESIREVMAEIEQEQGRLEILVNNAGIFLDKDGTAVMVPGSYIRTFSINPPAECTNLRTWHHSWVELGVEIR